MIDFSKLKVPFPEKDIEWRIQSAGKTGDRLWPIVTGKQIGRAHV